MNVHMDAVDEFIARYRAGERPKLRFVGHSLTRGVEMGDQLGLSADEIRRAMLEPTSVFRSVRHDGAILRHGRCSLGVKITDEGEPVVVTILWSSKGDWLDSYRAGVPAGRERRQLSEMFR